MGSSGDISGLGEDGGFASAGVVTPDIVSAEPSSGLSPSSEFLFSRVAVDVGNLVSAESSSVPPKLAEDVAGDFGDFSALFVRDATKGVEAVATDDSRPSIGEPSKSHKDRVEFRKIVANLFQAHLFACVRPRMLFDNPTSSHNPVGPCPSEGRRVFLDEPSIAEDKLANGVHRRFRCLLCSF